MFLDDGRNCGIETPCKNFNDFRSIDREREKERERETDGQKKDLYPSMFIIFLNL